MSAARRLLSPLIAITVGVVSGVYVFSTFLSLPSCPTATKPLPPEPLLESYAEYADRSSSSLVQANSAVQVYSRELQARGRPPFCACTTAADDEPRAWGGAGGVWGATKGGGEGGEGGVGIVKRVWLRAAARIGELSWPASAARVARSSDDGSWTISLSSFARFTPESLVHSL